MKNYLIFIFLFCNCFCMDFTRLQNELAEERKLVQKQIIKIIKKERANFFLRDYSSETVELNQDQIKRTLQWGYPKIAQDFFESDCCFNSATKEDCERKLYEIKNLLKQLEQKGTAPYTWNRFTSFFKDVYDFKPTFPISIKDLYRWQDIKKEDKELGLSNKHIYSFEGLEPGLRKLYLRKNLLTRIGSNAFPNSLLYLDLSLNHITHFDMNAFANLSNLKNLLLVSVGLKIIPNIKHLDTLTELNLHGNKITTVTKEQLPKKLENLSLSDNKIKTLDQNVFTTLTCLEKLDLDYNQLASFNCFLPQSLKRLQLAANRNLESIDPAIFKQRTDRHPPTMLRISLACTKLKPKEFSKHRKKRVFID